MDTESHEDVDNVFDSSSTLPAIASVDGIQAHEKLLLFLGLGSDNFWYAFSATAVHNIFQSVISDAFKESVRDILTHKLPNQTERWEMVGKSGKRKLTQIWSLNGSLDTLSWSKNVPIDAGNKNTVVIMHFL